MHTFDLEILRIDRHEIHKGLDWVDVMHRAREHDQPGEPREQSAFQQMAAFFSSEYSSIERYVAFDGGRAVGALELELALQDNEHLVEFSLAVAPEHRRRGIGTALLAFAERRAAELGRDTLLTAAVERLEGGADFDESGRRFAASRSYTVVDQGIHSRNDLTLTAPQELDRRYADAMAHAEGYEVLQYAGRIPDDDVVDGIAVLCERMYTDAPTADELDVRPAFFDNARIREYERVREERAELQIITAVRHIATGTVAGYTFLLVKPGVEDHAWQDDTIVLPEHRGHRLGLVLKIANQRLLLRHRPSMRYLHTWNAEANDRMVEINAMLGYRPRCRDLMVQKKLTNP